MLISSAMRMISLSPVERKSYWKGKLNPSLSNFCTNEGWNFLPGRRSSRTWRKALIFSDKMCASIPTGNCSSSLPRRTFKPSWAASGSTIKAALGMSAADLIDWLNPKIRGWANYHRHVVSKRIFNRVDHAIFISLWQWARRRHQQKSRLAKRKYFDVHGGGTGHSSGKHAMTTGNLRKCALAARSSHAHYNDTSKSKAKPTHMTPPMKPTSQTVKGPICEIHFGVRPLFAFSGVSKTDAAPYAMRESPASPDGGFTTAFPW